MPVFKLFQRYGAELEYMIVDAASLDIRPIADKIVHAVGAARKNEVRHGKLRLSNELVLHVIELKTDGPARSLDGLQALFQEEVRSLNHMLADYGCCLLPTAMHPWMDPHRETRLWPYGNKDIYETFDRIFDCRGHGWSNLQSTHINLPFSGDSEFRRLHAAIRLVLPLLPALAASSPFLDGRVGDKLDNRLEAYRVNCARIPSVTGKVVPELVTTREQYEQQILQRIYDDLAPHDPQGILRDEWANARGAIARFSRGTIEIRVLDIQECPAADLAILQFIAAVLKALVHEDISSLRLQEAVPLEDLEAAMLATIADGEQAVIESRPLRAALGLANLRKPTASAILAALLESCVSDLAAWRREISFIIENGPLARRLLKRVENKEVNRKTLDPLYRELADCLQEGRLFK